MATNAFSYDSSIVHGLECSQVWSGHTMQATQLTAIAVPQGQTLVNCMDLCLVTRTIIVSLKAANGLLIVFCILQQTFNDMPHQTVFERIPEICQLFSIVQLGLTMYHHVELLPEAIPIQYIVVEGGDIDIWQFEATADTMRQWTSCSVAEQSLNSQAQIKEGLVQSRLLVEQTLVLLIQRQGATGNVRQPCFLNDAVFDIRAWRVPWQLLDSLVGPQHLDETVHDIIHPILMIVQQGLFLLQSFQVFFIQQLSNMEMLFLKSECRELSLSVWA